ncbi:MAG: diaminopimelate epimerase [Candidatus Eisenbacteria bacterium]|uniref:Diaminopimelate epimerase n=1 Tax=Eiseniibacteriota bacterium TaxID=2212470 RepID=A0A538U1R1_UNCEI|nr:MAG: diaminopimelate epimerase [Candidatus Eisenbacteria bacterium]
MREIPFLKMHGAANDFVVVDHRAPFLPEPLADLVRRLCDRRRGIGADGVLLLERDPELDFAMRYWNADGGVAEFCGNGARCLARLALELGLGRDGEVRFRVGARAMRARWAADGRAIELVFGVVGEPAEPWTIEVAGRRFEGRWVTAGVPHFVVPVERVEWVPVAEWGAALRHHPRFEPEGTNVDFVARLGPSRVAMRTYERGVEAETLACGSGAMAAAVCSAALGEPPPVSIVTAGGDELSVGLVADPGGWKVSLTGPAEVAFRGTWVEASPVEAGAR